jgi:AcrR family transcriptional regulator
MRLPAAERRRQLLDVAVDVFATRGYFSTSMADVAAGAGVTKPVLYQHFESKESLYLELLADVGDRLLHEIQTAVSATQSPRDRVRQGFRSYFSFVAQDPSAFLVLFGGATRRVEQFEDEALRVEAVIAETIADLIDIPEMSRERRLLLARGVVSIAEGTSRSWINEDVTLDPTELADQVAGLVWGGLRKPGFGDSPNAAE